MEFERELLKGSTETLLLSLLTHEPMYGYQLLREMERRSRGYFHFKEGTLYPALHRLERENLIEALWMSAPAGQSRRYYTITGQGRRALARRTSVWSSFANAVTMVMQTQGSAS
ncbi:MAG: helix-turn-helix transcriptional regulator [Chloroflexi bacterium]|nr:helix-turn-helix transcriptional regulator [Chloroflexota bacterium]